MFWYRCPRGLLEVQTLLFGFDSYQQWMKMLILYFSVFCFLVKILEFQQKFQFLMRIPQTILLLGD